VIPIIVAKHAYTESIEKTEINLKNRFDANNLTLTTYSIYVIASV